MHFYYVHGSELDIAGETERKEDKGACFKELAIRHGLCLKREERQEEKEVTSVDKAKISLHPTWLAKL